MNFLSNLSSSSTYYKRKQPFAVSSLVLFFLLIFLRCNTPTEPSNSKNRNPGYHNEIVYSDHKEVTVGYFSADGIYLEGVLYLPLTKGKHPAVILQSGAGEWTRFPFEEQTGIPSWIRYGVAVLTYDKRGVGASEGECCNWRDTTYYYKLADDISAGINILKQHDEIDSERIGLFGGSEGGWVISIAAARNDVFFTIAFSGPAVTLREELFYSYYTGDDQCCQPTGLSEEEIYAGWLSGTLSDGFLNFLNGDGFTIRFRFGNR